MEPKKISNPLPGQEQDNHSQTTSSEIELTQEEIEIALAKARREKYVRLETQAYWEKVKNPEPIPAYTPEKFLEMCLKKFQTETGKTFLVDDHNREILETLSAYFTGGDIIDQRKGLLLQGNVGCGKTAIMQMFKINPKQSYWVTGCGRIARSFSEEGYTGIEHFFHPSGPGNGNVFRHEYFGVCFDDIGTETAKNNWGNKSNTMEEIILGRYERRHDMQGMTHITTNLKAFQIEEFYGPRVRSRILEMFNIIKFPDGSPDRRRT